MEKVELMFSNKHIEISFDVAYRYLYCNWKGYQTKKSIMTAGKIILDLLQQKGASKVLNDNTWVTGSWNDAAAWTTDEWFPKMIDAGLRHFAWIFSPNIFAELSAKSAMPVTEFIKSFNSLDEARNWLVNQN